MYFNMEVYLCSIIIQPDISASIATAIINGMRRGRERRVLKGKRRGRERGKPEAAEEAEEDKPMRKGKSRRDKSLAPAHRQYHIVPKTGVQTSVLT